MEFDSIYEQVFSARDTTGQWNTVKCHGIPWEDVQNTSGHTSGYLGVPCGNPVGYRGAVAVKWDVAGYRAW